ncbi:MAG: hypothetical protein WBG50_27490 [Desulfomonilaceae bacterium]
MMSRKSQKKTKKTRGTRPLDRLKSKLRKEALFRKTKFVGHNSSDEKISEVVMRFVEPYAPYMETEHQWKILIGMALIAWNAALFPHEERKAVIDEHINDSTIFMLEEAKKVFYELIERKDKYFANYNQVLAAFDLTMTSNGPSLTVAYLRQRSAA